MHRRFEMVRTEDPSQFSGTGVVMEGVEFSDGRVALRWCTEHQPRSTVIWDSFDEALQVHGHMGATTARWLD